MTTYDQVIQAIFDAIREANETLSSDEALTESPDTVIAGQSGTLDSLGFVNLTVAVEQNVERISNEAVSVIDIVASNGHDTWTVAVLAERITEALGQSSAETQVTGT